MQKFLSLLFIVGAALTLTAFSGNDKAPPGDEIATYQGINEEFVSPTVIVTTGDFLATPSAQTQILVPEMLLEEFGYRYINIAFVQERSWRPEDENITSAMKANHDLAKIARRLTRQKLLLC